MSCAVKGCFNARRFKPEGITFHRFPRGDMFQKWVESLRLHSEFKWSENKFVCSNHFKKTDFIAAGTQIRLKPDTVPNLEINVTDKTDSPFTSLINTRAIQKNVSFTSSIASSDETAECSLFKRNFGVPKRERRSGSSTDSLTPPPSPRRIAPSRKSGILRTSKESRFPEIQISNVHTVWDDDPVDENYKQKRKMLPSTSSKNQLEFLTVVEDADETAEVEEKSVKNNSYSTLPTPAANVNNIPLISNVIENKNSPKIQPIQQLVLLPASITNPPTFMQNIPTSLNQPTIMVIPQGVQTSNLIFQGLPLVSTGNLASNSVGIVCNNSVPENIVKPISSGRSVLNNNSLTDKIVQPVSSGRSVLNNNSPANNVVHPVSASRSVLKNYLMSGQVAKPVVTSSDSVPLKSPKETPAQTPKSNTKLSAAKSGNHVENIDSITELDGDNTLSSDLAEEWEKVASIEIKKRKPLPRYFGDISSDDMDSPPRARVSLNVARKTVTNLKGKVRRLLKQNRRLKEKVESMKKLYCYLEDNNYLNQYAKAAIKAVMPDEVDSIFEPEEMNEDKDLS